LSSFKDFKFKNLKPINGAIFKKNLEIISKRHEAEEIRDKIQQLIKISKVVVKKDSKLEISHHYGMKNFYNYGLTMITIHNSKYCKKLLFILNKQVHPEQYHNIKEETFFVLFGKIKLQLTEKKIKKTIYLSAGEIFTIKTGVIHKFICISKQGAVIEELSTSHIKSDSFYIDKKINTNRNRKTLISLN
tara:strand:- start:109 stop:675 length:567 start_codon:yes stop_codon:yes gene_type:complete